jgi:hypothetical protein
LKIFTVTAVLYERAIVYSDLKWRGGGILIPFISGISRREATITGHWREIGPEYMTTTTTVFIICIATIIPIQTRAVQTWQKNLFSRVWLGKVINTLTQPTTLQGVTYSLILLLLTLTIYLLLSFLLPLL